MDEYHSQAEQVEAEYCRDVEGGRGAGSAVDGFQLFHVLGTDVIVQVAEAVSRRRRPFVDLVAAAGAASIGERGRQ